LNSKKHKENELKTPSQARVARDADSDSETDDEPDSTSKAMDEPDILLRKATVPESLAGPSPQPSAVSSSDQHGVGLSVESDATEEEVKMTLDQKIATARSRLSPAHCLFCATKSASLEDNLTHMSEAHSFFIPDAEYLVDLTGLITYLGEKIAVGNVCLYCNGRGREFRTLDAVRKHMVDKSHCKLAYDKEAEMLEIADYYDFTSSYPDAEEHAKRKAERRALREESRRLREEKRKEKETHEEEWEDSEDVDGEVDEVVTENVSEPEDSDSPSQSDDDESSGDDSLADNQVTYGDSPYELVLPGGQRLIHRDMQRYFKQRISVAPSRGGRTEDSNSGAALVRRLLAEKNSALVPRKGGFGAFGGGTDVIKARNAGEAREAGRHVREFRDQRRREQFKTKVGFRNNNQKHFRDPLLQVSSYTLILNSSVTKVMLVMNYLCCRLRYQVSSTSVFVSRSSFVLKDLS
jgi:pre-60S factor REI1